ncbi:MAG: AraC family transcriptional regulator [Lachnospiraceae bacterium]|nr:AraC family transcriptional regulator [Lachnospiraceae bacterium]
MNIEVNNIFMIDDYVVLKPHNSVESHCHKMPHIISGTNPFKICINGQIREGRSAIIPSDVEHSIVSMDDSAKMLLIMPLTNLYFQIKDRIKSECIIYEQYYSVDEIISELNSSCITYEKVIDDKRVIEIIEKINNDTYLDKSVAEIAKLMNLSESRLEHLFSEKTGIRLKHYLLLHKLRKAYKQVCEGKSITEAAYEGGFADSSHLAVVSKRLLGISVSDVIKNND